MTLTVEKLTNIHPVYVDFMMALKPIIDSQGQPFKIGGLPASTVFDNSARKYGYNPQQFYEIADNLRHQGLLDIDKFGFYSPTGTGEKFIHELAQLLNIGDQPPSTVPHLDLGE